MNQRSHGPLLSLALALVAAYGAAVALALASSPWIVLSSHRQLSERLEFLLLGSVASMLLYATVPALCLCALAWRRQEVSALYFVLLAFCAHSALIVWAAPGPVSALTEVPGWWFVRHYVEVLPIPLAVALVFAVVMPRHSTYRRV
jgi:hypothetical protein